jgi:hypothetical protein
VAGGMTGAATTGAAMTAGGAAGGTTAGAEWAAAGPPRAHRSTLDSSRGSMMDVAQCCNCIINA